MGAIFNLGSKGKLVLDSCSFENIEGDILSTESDSSTKIRNTSFRKIRANPVNDFQQLTRMIKESAIDKSAQERLVKDVISLLQHKNNDHKGIQSRLLTFIGQKASDLFIQLLAAVAAGGILRVT